MHPPCPSPGCPAIAVIERQGKTFLNPVRIYGARDANGASGIGRGHSEDTNYKPSEMVGGG